MQITNANLEKYVRAANYLSAAQIYLQDNWLLDRKLTFADIKPRLLGHWGTCPGINFIYAHLNRLIKEVNSNMLFVLGPGHGFAALQANLFIEGTFSEYYPKATLNLEGLAYVIRNFSWPYGFPSHSNPGAPGVLVEGGELGYALSTAYGTVLDNPELITVCVVGDGEAETGPTATAWHLNKLVNSVGNGTVLPILHLNEYKISGPTFFGRMSDEELSALFAGYGYTVHIVDGSKLDETMREALDVSYQQIGEIREQWRQDKLADSARMPMIILRTKKGWTGIRELAGQSVEGSWRSHQAVVKNAKSDATELAALEEWLGSYRFSELFDAEKGFSDDVLAVVPESKRRLGANEHAYGGKRVYTPLKLPEIEECAEDTTIPGTIGSSSMRRTGCYLNKVFQLNEDTQNFRLFSPDETYSNKLDEVFNTTTRPFTWPRKSSDQDMDIGGRVMEVLSEHSLQGLMQGYVLTGRHGVFASYEAFIQIVSSMADQYAKFLKVARQTSWRGDVPSFNYILTSSGWRQEHNGFSHQNPSFIDDMLQRQGCFVNVHFPPDGNSTLVCLQHCLSSVNSINVIVAGKTLEPRWLTLQLAEEERKRGLMVWKFASDDDPQVVLAAAGDYLTKEALAAIDLVKNEVPDARLRFVNIMTLSALGLGNADCRVPFHDFADYFTADRPIIFNFHGYPQTLKQLLFDTGVDYKRCSVHGYIENGSTTTPFDMQVRNGTSRYHLAIEVFERLASDKVIPVSESERFVKQYQKKLRDHRSYIEEHGVDPKEIEQWQWSRTSLS